MPLVVMSAKAGTSPATQLARWMISSLPLERSMLALQNPQVRNGQLHTVTPEGKKPFENSEASTTRIMSRSTMPETGSEDTTPGELWKIAAAVSESAAPNVVLSTKTLLPEVGVESPEGRVIIAKAGQQDFASRR